MSPRLGRCTFTEEIVEDELYTSQKEMRNISRNKSYYKQNVLPRWPAKLTNPLWPGLNMGKPNAEVAVSLSHRVATAADPNNLLEIQNWGSPTH